MSDNIRLLTISVNSWSDTNCTGNTFSNFLGKYSKENIANIFCKNEIPCNDICVKYYKITEKDIISNIVNKRHKVGNIYSNRKVPDNMNNKYTSNNRFSNFKGKSSIGILFARELLWSLGTWKNKELNKFLSEFNPNIIYMHGHMGYYMHKLLRYCKDKTNSKVVLFFGDDMYSYKSRNPVKNLYHFFMRRYLRKSIAMADLIYGGSEQLCLEYTKLFKKEFNLLYKGINIKEPLNKEKNNIITITYAGNLLYGRWETLEYLANAIKEVNKGGIRVKLCIYTQTPLTTAMDQALNIPGCSEVLGKISYSEVQNGLNLSDIVLHVESFKPSEIKKTRLSFSTKIIDCIQSGSCIMAIGPNNIESIKYLIKSDSAIVITDEGDIEKSLINIINNTKLIKEYENRMYKFASNNHSLESVQLKIFSDIKELT